MKLNLINGEWLPGDDAAVNTNPANLTPTSADMLAEAINDAS